MASLTGITVVILARRVGMRTPLTLSDDPHADYKRGLRRGVEQYFEADQGTACSHTNGVI